MNRRHSRSSQVRGPRESLRMETYPGCSAPPAHAPSAIWCVVFERNENHPRCQASCASSRDAQPGLGTVA